MRTFSLKLIFWAPGPENDFLGPGGPWKLKYKFQRKSSHFNVSQNLILSRFKKRIIEIGQFSQISKLDFYINYIFEKMLAPREKLLFSKNYFFPIFFTLLVTDTRGPEQDPIIIVHRDHLSPPSTEYKEHKDPAWKHEQSQPSLNISH